MASYGITLVYLFGLTVSVTDSVFYTLHSQDTTYAPMHAHIHTRYTCTHARTHTHTPHTHTHAHNQDNNPYTARYKKVCIYIYTQSVVHYTVTGHLLEGCQSAGSQW